MQIYQIKMQLNQNVLFQGLKASLRYRDALNIPFTAILLL